MQDIHEDSFLIKCDCLTLQTKKTNMCNYHAPLLNSGKELQKLLLTIKIRWTGADISNCEKKKKKKSLHYLLFKFKSEKMRY